VSIGSAKILADILISNKLFNNFQINLVGFSLGANVVKYCIKELNDFNGKKNYIKFKNVILIGAATHLKHEDKWKDIIKNNVIDRFINCYSGCDDKLKSLYSKI
jgi:predicted alpha/beta-fold hydrolase